MTKVERLIEMVRALDAAEAEVARIKRELAETFGEGGAVQAARSVVRSTPPSIAARGERAPRGQRLAQVADLAKSGLDVPAMAEKLGISAAAVRATLLRARKKHLLPKAEATR